VELDPARIPRHVAIIMDGTAAGPSSAASRACTATASQGLGPCRRRVGAAPGHPYHVAVRVLHRELEPPAERSRRADAALAPVLASELDKMMKHGIRLVAVGTLRRLPPAVREALRARVDATRNNTGMTVISP